MRLHYNSPVILTYAFISLGVLLVGEFFSQNFVINFFAVYRTSFSDPLAYFRVFSYVFGHANFNHFFGNISMLLLIGPMIEEKYSSKVLIIMMIASTLIGGIAHLLFFSAAALGASGIVFMLILLTPFTNMQRGRIPITFILVALVFIGREVFYAITIEDNVSRFGHIIGGASGAAMGYFASSNKRGASR